MKLLHPLAPLLLVLSGCAWMYYHDPQVPTYEPPSSRQPDPKSVASALVIGTGVLTHVHRDRRYEAACGIIAALLKRCNQERAYIGRIVWDSTLTSGHKDEDVLFFVWPDSSGMGDGTHALWVVHRHVVQVNECTRYGCLTELWPTIDSDDDVLPLAAWEVVSRYR